MGGELVRWAGMGSVMVVVGQDGSEFQLAHMVYEFLPIS